MPRKPAAPKAKKQPCPRAHFHRPGTYCKSCDSIPKERGV